MRHLITIRMVLLTYQTYNIAVQEGGHFLCSTIVFASTVLYINLPYAPRISATDSRTR